jgi:hypothetical protein
MPQLYELIDQYYNSADLQVMCAELGIDFDNLSGSIKKLKCLSLQEGMGNQGRTSELLVALSKNPAISPDISKFLYLVIADVFPTESAMTGLLEGFGITPRNFGGPEKFSWGSEPWRLQKAEALQQYMQGNERVSELLKAIESASIKRNMAIDLSFYDSTWSDQNVSTTNSIESKDPSAEVANFSDFDLFISSFEGEHCTIRAEGKLRGEQKLANHVINFEDPELQDLLTYLRGLVARPEDAERLGDLLRQAMFPQSIMNHLQQSLTEAKAAGMQGLRLRFRFDIDDDIQARLSQMPWEYIRDDRSYLALNSDMPMVRYLNTDQPAYKPIAGPKPIKILVVMASPNGYPELNVEAEATKVRESLDKLEENGQVELKIVENATVDDLFTYTQLEFKPHILHFIGHGILKDNGEGALVLEDGSNEKNPELSDADDLLNLLRVSDVKVVFLSACLTSAFGADQAIMGIAPRLLWAGIPAVIAMQFAIPDKAATTFMGDLYRFLAAGEPLDVAVAKARLGTYFKGRDKIYWGIPTLFMRAPDGVLWQQN